MKLKYSFLIGLILCGLFNISAFATASKQLAQVLITTERNSEGKPTHSFSLTKKDIEFFQKGKTITSGKLDSKALLELKITSKRLTLIPAKDEADAELLYKHLFSNKEVMEKYSTGKTLELSTVTTRCKRACQRFISGDPYTDYMVYSTKDHKSPSPSNFLGRLTIGHGSEKEGIIEFATLVRLKEQSKGFGTEMLYTGVEMVKFFRDAKLKIGPNGTLPVKVMGTARVDNERSWQSMKKVGFKPVEKETKVDKYGQATRYTYFLDLPSQ